MKLLWSLLLLISGISLILLPRSAPRHLDPLVELVQWGWVVGGVALVYTGHAAEVARRRLLALLAQSES